MTLQLLDSQYYNVDELRLSKMACSALMARMASSTHRPLGEGPLLRGQCMQGAGFRMKRNTMCVCVFQFACSLTILAAQKTRSEQWSASNGSDLAFLHL